MPTCLLRRAAKIEGTRYPVGATVDVSDAVHAQLVATGVVESVPPTPPVVSSPVRIPRGHDEKQAALVEAQARIAKATGAPVPEPADPVSASE